MPSALHRAAVAGDKAALRRLLEAGGSEAPLLGADENGMLPLHCAAWAGHEEAARLLIEAGTDPNAASIATGFTPLVMAAMGGHSEVVRLLLVEYGADVNKTGAHGGTPVLLAAANGHEEALRLLLDAGGAPGQPDLTGGTPVYYAASRNEVGALAALHEAGADLAQGNECSQTPLHYASEEGHLEAVELLLQVGVPVNVRDDNGTTPLYMACGGGHSEVAAALMAAGADSRIANNSSQTPLHIASQQGLVDVVASIVEGASPEVAEGSVLTQDYYSYTPVHFAADNGHPKLLRLLLKAAPAAAAVVARGNGLLPLELALLQTHAPPSPGAARLLLAEGDLLTAPDSDTLDLLIVRILRGAGRLGHRLLYIPVERKALAREAWALVPSPCPGLGRALPAVLARSAAEARWLLWHLSPEERARLWTAALCLAQAQRQMGLELPAPVVTQCLASIFSD